jgi:hypothetical protein
MQNPVPADTYPTGPFIRISNASLAIPAIDNFSIQGDMFLSSTQFNAALTTTSIDIPNADADNLLHVGSSEWVVDFDKNSHFRLESHPPAVRILGRDMLPQTEIAFDLNPVSGHWVGLFLIPDGFNPLPGVVEFGPSAITAAYNGSTTLAVDGTMRLLKLPDQTWAREDSVILQVSDGPFSFNLSPYLPSNLIDFQGLTATKGSTSLARDASGVYTLNIVSSDISVFGQSIGTASGSVGTDGALDLVSTAFSTGVPAGPFSLERKNSGDSFRVKLRSQLSNPSLRVSLPRLLVKSSTVTGWPSAGVEMPGFAFNVDGAFDTGKVPIRTFSFDGIGISAPDDAELKKNYVRLKREAHGDTLFKIEARMSFPFPPPLDCDTHTLRFTIDNGTVSGTYSGKFCLPLDDPVSLDYSSGSSCQFQLSSGIYDFYFGSTCAGVKVSGFCTFGVCPP